MILGKSVLPALKGFSLVFGLLLNIQSCADMDSETISLSIGREMTNDGTLRAHKKISLICGGVLKGTGLLEAPEIEIKTKSFAFTGTISCTKKCIIKAREPFDYALFKRTGGGEFVITVEPNS